jgi:hypothetical protein
LDLDLQYRIDETGTWIKLTGSSLGFDNREVRFEHERQGDWAYFVDFSQTPAAEPLNVSTGLTGIGAVSQSTAGTGLRAVELETKREHMKLGFAKQLGRGFDVNIDFAHDEKNGARLLGAEGFNFLTEPIEFTHQEVKARLGFNSHRLQMSDGYYTGNTQPRR